MRESGFRTPAWRLGAMTTAFLLPWALGASLWADDVSNKAGVAKSVGETATMVGRKAMDQPWRLVKQGDELPAEELLVGMHGAALDSGDGAVRLAMFTDLDGRSPYPVVESAVILHDKPGTDLDFTLDRGRVDLVNRKDKGAAHVRLHVRHISWNITLEQPGTHLALLLYGRWLPGSTFNPKPGPRDVPAVDLVFLVINGQVHLDHDNLVYELDKPPGPAFMEWDGIDDQDDSPTRLDKLPDWARTASNSATSQATRARQARARAMLQSKGIEATIQSFLNSEDAADRRAAVNMMEALDDLRDLGAAMRNAKHPDVIDNGIVALRRWIGRAPGQDQILYHRLVNVGHMTPVHATTAVQLLHSFGDEELAQPDVYQMLIDYLGHPELAIRALAYWHLSRLVPAGKKFSYRPQAPADEREAAIGKWRRLVPAGTVPARFASPTK